MHLLQARPGTAVDETEAVDLGQTPGDVVFLSAADTELAGLARSRAGFGDGFPSLRLANLTRPSDVGGPLRRYGRREGEARRRAGARGRRLLALRVEQLAETCRAASIPLALLPGDDQPDPTLAALGTVPAQTAHRLWQYCVHGGPANARNLLAFAADLIGHAVEWREPAPLPRAGLYRPGPRGLRLRRPRVGVDRRRARRGHRVLPRPRAGGQPRPRRRAGARPRRARGECASALRLEPEGPDFGGPRRADAGAGAGAGSAERHRLRGVHAGGGTPADAVRCVRPARASGGARGR